MFSNNRAQSDTVLGVVVGAITVLLAVIIFANVFSALPEAGFDVVNESWAFNGSDSGTYTKQLTNTDLIEESVSVYNSTTTFTEDTDYTIDHDAGQITNMSTGLIGGHADFVNYTDTFGVDYEYMSSGFVTARGSVRTIFYSSMGLVIIGFLVLAAIFILAAVQRLRGAGE